MPTLIASCLRPLHPAARVARASVATRPIAVASAAIALLAFSIGASSAAAQATPNAALFVPPKLVVQITVDQLRPDYLERYASQLTGGLGRMMRSGAYFTDAVHDHGATETAPGHATLWSGRFPSHTGIVRNEIGVQDPQSPLLFGRGGGASPWRFRGTALFDWIRNNDPWSRALSVSRKDRGAILPLGRSKQQVYWYSLDGRFTTSRYYADTVPDWVERFNERDFLSRYLGKEWTLLLAASAYPEADSVALESGGRNFVFPHRMPTERRAAGTELTEFPWMDDVTVEFALEGLRQLELGNGPGTDVLSVSLSTTDAVGHRYGPDSREVHDQVLRVDRALGVLIDSLYRLRDSTTIVFALSADHGVAPYPQRHFAGDTTRGRAEARQVIDSTRSRLLAMGVETDALTLETGIVILDSARLVARNIDVDSVVQSIRERFLRLPGVTRVDRVETLDELAAGGDVVARRWRNSITPDLGAVLTVTLEPYWYWNSVRYPTHGMPHDYDAAVPILFMGPGIKAGRYDQPIRTVDVAPTLAALLGVQPTEPVDGRVLREIFSGPTGIAPRVRRRE